VIDDGLISDQRGSLLINVLINAGRNKHRYQRIAEASRDTCHVWSAVKDLLYTSHQYTIKMLTDDNSCYSLLAVFFCN